jgi:glycosyltransferase involved in cell wall biosynthesis
LKRGETLKKKILFVNGHLNVGGVENSLLNVLKNMDYDNYEVDLILFEDLGDYVNEIPKEVNIIFYDITKVYGPIKSFIFENFRNRNWSKLGLRFILILDKIFGAKALLLAKPYFNFKKIYDCSIAYRVGICTDFVGYVINSKVKITWWHHGSIEYEPKMIKRWENVYRKFDKIIAVSDSSMNMIRKNIKGIRNKTFAIPNIINTEEILNKAKDTCNLVLDDQETINLISVGRLSPEKGMLNCVYTCKKLVDNGYNVKWYLIGEGEQLQEIEKCIKDQQLDDHIFLLGAIPNPYPYIKNAYIYVHPSLVESLSISVLEAFALNTPVTVARSMGPEEFIRHEENGLLVDPSPTGLYEGIVSLIENEKLYRQLKKGKIDVLSNYSPQVVMNKIYRHLEV